MLSLLLLLLLFYSIPFGLDFIFFLFIPKNAYSNVAIKDNIVYRIEVHKHTETHKQQKKKSQVCIYISTRVIICWYAITRDMRDVHTMEVRTKENLF